MPSRRDLGLALLLFVVAEIETIATGDAPSFTVAVAVFTLGLAWRREHALALAVASTIAILLSGLIEPAEWNSMAAIAAFLIVAYAAGAHEPRARAIAALGILLGGSILEELLANSTETDLLFGFVVYGSAWLAGRGVRARREQVRHLADLTDRLARERERTADLAVADERLRVARDLHDTVAGLLGVMVVQAGAAQASPGNAADAVAVVQAAGREAADALAEMLRALGGVSEGEPQPGLGRLDDLVAFARSAGLPVDVEVVDPRPLPAGLELSAYRIVQESLTNVVKHAGGARTAIRLRYEPDALRIEVSDDGAPAVAPGLPGTRGGHGLLSMRERAALFGGDLDAGARAGGGFEVRARLPVP